MDDNINAEITYPVLNDETIDIEIFNSVMNSDHPVVNNWDKSLISVAHHVGLHGNVVGVGLSQESNVPDGSIVAHT